MAKMASRQGQDAGSVVDKGSAAQGSATSVVTYQPAGLPVVPGTILPQEIKIQIKLPKPGSVQSTATLTTVQGPTQQTLGQPVTQIPPPPGMPFGSPPPTGVPSPFGSASVTAQSPVLQPASINTGQAQESQVGSVKDLLLRDRSSSLQPSQSQEAPLVVIDPPQEEVAQALAGINASSTSSVLQAHTHHDVR